MSLVVHASAQSFVVATTAVANSVALEDSRRCRTAAPKASLARLDAVDGVCWAVAAPIQANASVTAAANRMNKTLVIRASPGIDLGARIAWLAEQAMIDCSLRE